MLNRATKRTGRVVIGLVIAGGLALGTGVAVAAAAPGGPQGPNAGQGACLESVELTTLSDAEIDGILFMREEEKLARDVYQVLYDEWEHRVFQNIAGSEQAHMDAVGVLIQRYNLEDPIVGNEIGAFTDAELQSLYDQLVGQGSESLAAALRVGAAVEEIDILDLEELIAETEAIDVTTVYENLLRGSRNHLRAFVSVLERETGETYVPQHLTEAAYEEIMAVDLESGRGGQRLGVGRRVEPGWGFSQSQTDPARRAARQAGFGRSPAGVRGEGRGGQQRGLGEGECLQ